MAASSTTRASSNASCRSHLLQVVLPIISRLLVGRPFQAADPISIGSSRLESRLRARLARPTKLLSTSATVKVMVKLYRYSCILALSKILCTGQPAPELAVIQLIDAAELRRETRLRGYTVTEHYTIKSSRFNHSAEMTVAVSYRRDQGK